MRSTMLKSKSFLWILIIQIITALIYHGFSTIIPFIQEDLSLSNTLVGYMSSSMFLGASLIAIPAGVITDNIGVKKTLILFNTLIVSVLILFIFANYYAIVLTLLLFLGFGYGAIAPSTNRGVMDIFIPHNRGTAMGIKQMGVPLGVVIATVIFPILSKTYNWRVALFVMGIVLSIVTFLFLFNRTIITQNIEKESLIKKFREVIFNKETIKVSLLISVYMSMQTSMTTFYILYLLYGLDIKISLATLCFSVLFIGGSVGRAFWGFISDYFFGSKRYVVFIFIGYLSSLFLIILTLLNHQTPFVLVLILSFALGISVQGWNGISIIMLAESSKSSNVGLSTGFGSSIYNTGGIIGTPIFGFIADYTNSYKVMWLLIAFVILTLSISLTLAIMKKRISTIK